MKQVNRTSTHAGPFSGLCAAFSGLGSSSYPLFSPESSVLIEAIIGLMPSPVFFKAPVSGRIAVNRCFEEALGSSGRPVVEEMVRRFTSGSVKAAEFDFTHPDGTRRYALCNMSECSCADGSGAGVIGVITDITGHRRLEDELARSEERYRALFEESNDGFFHASIDGSLLDVSPAAVSLLGYSSADELKGLDCAVICSEPSDRDRFLAEISRSGRVKDFEAVVLRKDGTPVALSINAAVVEGAGGAAREVRGFFRDVTRHKQLEERILHSQKMEAIGKLTGGIAHDFNNMIMAIHGYSTLVRSRLAEGDEARRYVEQLMDVTDRAANLTKRLLAFGRKQAVSLAPVSLNEVAQRAGHLITRLIGERVEFVMSLGGQNLTVMADGGQLEQLLLNLATNARDAMAGRGTLTVRTSLETIDDAFIEANGFGIKGPYACISVRDTGAGIDASTLKRIFDPFFTTKDVGKGTGLGLSIVYGIVKQHSGFITVESTPGSGAEFKVFLPLVKARPKRLSTQLSMEPFTLKGKETVLLTEDDPGVREITRALLEESGYTVIEAVDGVDAVERFNENKDRISLLLFDLMMPRKNGKEAYDEIRRTAPLIKALFFSGYSEDIISSEGAFEPGVDFISKPVPPHELLKKVRMVLDSK